MDDPTPGADAPDDLAAAPLIAPPVVVVVIAHDPGPWFEETMAAIAAQDYPNLSILVVDAASADEVKPRVGRSAPGAFVRRLNENAGFGAAANEVLEVVEGAAFYLVCHDDIAPEPDVVRLLVEEAFRSNAAIVGPKLVGWDDPRKLLQVGEGIDHAGYITPLVERGELDQEQHDAVRDVFTIPGACTLVRADLFAEIGGFDEGIDLLYDDVSLCWRTHIAGARVIVAPSARVRHLEALGERRPVDDRSRLQNRHRLRVVLSCYSTLGLVRALPKTVVLQLLEAIYSVVVGRTANARDLANGWVWNLRRLGELRGARRQVRAFRRVPDSEVRRFMARGSARFNQFVRGQIGGGEDRLTGWARSGRDVAGALRSGTLRLSAMVWLAVALVLLAGSRHLITRGVPAVGELVAFTSSPMDLLREWASGWRTAGLGSPAPAPTAFGLLGGLGLAAAGTMGLLRTVLTVGLVPLGAVLAYRLAGPIGSRHAQIAALLVYVCNPLPYNALAAGRWSSLALYAAAPLVVAVLARAGGLAPFGSVDGSRGPGVRNTRLRHLVLALGFTTAVLAALVPIAVVIVPIMAAALALGSVIVYRVKGSGRMLVAAVGASVLAVALHLPWSLDLLLPGTPMSALTGPETTTGPSDLGALLRFEVGPLGSGLLGWVFLVAAALPLLIGRDERHAWAVRGWTLAIVFWALAWVAQRGDAPFALPPLDLLLAPCVAGLALSTAMGVAAFEVDLPGYRFGWRQIASGLAAAAVALGTVPVLGAAFDGRWSMPAGDHSRALGFIDAENDDLPFRVLWLGDPAALPLGSWQLDDGVAYATTDAGTPRAQDLWVGSDDGRTSLLADAIDLARTGQTARLGRLLAPMGVRYVVAPERLAPAPFGTEERPLPAGLGATLDAQLDLEPIDVPAGLTVFRNQAYFPARAVVSGANTPPEQGGIAAAIAIDLSRARLALPDGDGHLEWSGPTEADSTVLLSAAHSDRWELVVEGQAADQIKPFGWANGFTVTEAGDATLRFRTPLLRYGALLLQVLAWLWVARAVLPRPDGPGGPVGGQCVRSARITSLVLLAGAIAGGLVIQSAEGPTSSDAGPPTPRAGVALPAARLEPTLTSTWYCAGGTGRDGGSADHVVLIANPTDRPRTATLTVLTGEVAKAPSPEDVAAGSTTTVTTAPPTTTTSSAPTTTLPKPSPAERDVPVPAQSRVEVRLADISEAQLVGAVIEVDGGQIAVEHAVTGPLGRSTAPCSTTASTTWSFPWGVTARGARELLVFMNPFPDDATVDIAFATDEGVRDTARFQRFVVPGRSVVGAFIDQDVTRKQQVSSHVQVRGGRLVIDRIQMLDGTDGREGITLGLGVPTPAETWMFPTGETGPGLTEQVVVFNPSDAVAEVEVEARLDDPATNGTPEPFELTVAPGRYAIVDVHAEERVPAGVGHSLIVRSLNQVPITAERVNSGADPAPRRGITSTTGSPFGAPTWYFAGGGPTQSRDEYLVVMNVSIEDPVTFSVTGFRGGQTIAIQDLQGKTIEPGGRFVIRLGDHAEHENLPVVITADGAIVAERGLYRIGGGGISQAIGIPLAEHLFVPDPVNS